MLVADCLECLRGDRRLFSQLGFSLAPGELLHVAGDNGSGKTSLLRILAGLLPAESGSVSWRGAVVGSAEFRAALCYLGHQNAIKEDLTPLENLLSSVHVAAEAMREDAALAALAAAGLAGREDLPCRYLSQGQKRRVALARLVEEKRPLWILDEPFVALDAFAIDWLTGLIDAHLAAGGVAVLTTHQPVAVAAERTRRLHLGEAAC